MMVLLLRSCRRRNSDASFCTSGFSVLYLYVVANYVWKNIFWRKNHMSSESKNSEIGVQVSVRVDFQYLNVVANFVDVWKNIFWRKNHMPTVNQSKNPEMGVLARFLQRSWIDRSIRWIDIEWI
jgi:hypothetical protein